MYQMVNIFLETRTQRVRKTHVQDGTWTGNGLSYFCIKVISLTRANMTNDMEGDFLDICTLRT